jgi:hypothetical protein
MQDNINNVGDNEIWNGLNIADAATVVLISPLFQGNTNMLVRITTIETQWKIGFTQTVYTKRCSVVFFSMGFQYKEAAALRLLQMPDLSPT